MGLPACAGGLMSFWSLRETRAGPLTDLWFTVNLPGCDCLLRMIEWTTKQCACGVFGA